MHGLRKHTCGAGGGEAFISANNNNKNVSFTKPKVSNIKSVVAMENAHYRAPYMTRQRALVQDTTTRLQVYQNGRIEVATKSGEGKAPPGNVGNVQRFPLPHLIQGLPSRILSLSWKHGWRESRPRTPLTAASWWPAKRRFGPSRAWSRLRCGRGARGGAEELAAPKAGSADSPGQLPSLALRRRMEP